MFSSITTITWGMLDDVAPWVGLAAGFVVADVGFVVAVVGICGAPGVAVTAGVTSTSADCEVGTSVGECPSLPINAVLVDSRPDTLSAAPQPMRKTAEAPVISSHE